MAHAAALAGGALLAAGALLYLLLLSLSRRPAPAPGGDSEALRDLRARLPEAAALLGLKVAQSRDEESRSATLELRYTHQGISCRLAFIEEPPDSGAGESEGARQSAVFRFNSTHVLAPFCLHRERSPLLRAGSYGPKLEAGDDLVFRGPELLFKRLESDGLIEKFTRWIPGPQDRLEAGRGFVEWVTTGLPGPQKDLCLFIERRSQFVSWWKSRVKD